MSNYINRDDALGIVTRAFEASEVVDGTLPARFQLAVVLKCLNDLEPVDLVRCGECKWWNEETHGCNRNPCIKAWWETDYCSYGERRTDGV